MPTRDLDRIRELLLQAEAVPVDPEEDMYTGYVNLMDSVPPTDAYQLQLMRDAGFIEGRDATLGLFRITNSGHDYLDAIRDEGIWNKTKDGASKVGGFTLGILKEIAVSYLKLAIKEKLGINLS